ncbi:hypothetical protein PITCH_A1700011 [uncultured Desulfobacterium sp.]|uniref:N-sulphoglucosamine sulphohydrolase C-terminal domain-containing protein n=1 Tax=uncultured Desulfobacterium sp. TaxID=201089 RepID=A0A445MUI9_9BACT|nr:hypothetical protein PITCH_A1700011 [uncultured Desulfobacterium sp.]
MEHGAVLHGRTLFQEVVRVPLIFRVPGLPKGLKITENASLIDVMPTILSLVGISDFEVVDGIDLSQAWINKDFKMPQRYLFVEADWNNVISRFMSRDMAQNIKREGLTLRPVTEKTREGDVVVDDIKRAVRYGQYKLCYDRLTKQMQLYDLKNDPNERNDISSDKELSYQLFSRLEEFMKKGKRGKEVAPLSEEEIKRLKSLGYIH